MFYKIKSKERIKMSLIKPFFIVVLLFSMFISAFAQDKGLTLNLTQVSVLEVMKAIERQSEYTFGYNKDRVDLSRKISVNVTKEPLKQVLDMIFKDIDVNYSIIGNQIILEPKKKVIKKSKITGNVVDSKGESLPGVSVKIKGTSSGTATDINGNFIIDNVGGDATILLSYIGYKSKEVEVNGENNVEVVLEEDAIGLEDVVIVGYGQQKKESVIGAITTIAPKKLISSSASLSNTFAGRLAGVLSVQRSGEPGKDASDFWIRGVSTFNSAAQKALILVDGVERQLNDVDPNDIESFSILKDATATAVYGVRGANGVVLINTKRGKTGKPQIQFGSEYSFKFPTKFPKYVDGVTYMQTFNEACENSNVSHKFSDEQIANTIEAKKSGKDADYYPDVNWLDELFNDYSTSQKVNLNVSGGSEKVKYYISGVYLHENGILKNSDMDDNKAELKVDRFNYRSNIDVDITKTTLLKLNVGGFLKEKNQPRIPVYSDDNSTDNIFFDALATTPISYPKIYSDGKNAQMNGTRLNPWIAANRSGYQINTETQIESTISLEQKLDFIIEGVSTKGLFSFDANNLQNSYLSKMPAKFYKSIVGTTKKEEQISSAESYTLSEGNTYSRSMYMEFQINYNKKFLKNHNISALMLYNRSNLKKGPNYDLLLTLPYRHDGLAGRLAYGFADKYFIEGNFGYNGSENFEKGKKYDFFPSIALGWTASEEKIFKQYLTNYVNKLKFKVSYGKVGNDIIGDGTRRFGFLSTFGSLGGYRFGKNANTYASTIGYTQYGTQGLTWEIAKKSNFGIELGFFNAVDVSIDIYKENRSNILTSRKSIPASTGLNVMPNQNLGSMSNKGIDLSITGNKQIGKDLSISLNCSFTYATNIVEDKDEPAGTLSYQSEVGHRNGQYFGYKALGLYTRDDFNTDGTLKAIGSDGKKQAIPQLGATVNPGDIKYLDYDQNGYINSYDRIAIGYSQNPEIVYGFGSTIMYKNFDFGFLIQGVSNTSVMLGGEMFYPCDNSGLQGNILSNVSDRWIDGKNESQNVFWPRLYLTGSNVHNKQESTWWLKDASFWRLKNVEIGYSLNIKKIKEKVNLIRFYLRGTNVYTWSKDFDDLWDPELASTTGMKYPTSITYTLGLDVKF